MSTTVDHPTTTQAPASATGSAEPSTRRRVVVRRALLAVSALALAVPLLAFNAPAAYAHHDTCNTASWTWPFCEIRVPSVPRFNTDGPRPSLTPKNSAWCRNNYIQASSSGYTYWFLTRIIHHRLRFWPDYYTRYYELMTWDVRQRQFVRVPYSRSYPDAIQAQTIFCGT